MIKRDNDFDFMKAEHESFDKKFNFMMKFGKIAFAFWIVIVLCLGGGMIWVTIHFLSKFW